MYSGKYQGKMPKLVHLICVPSASNGGRYEKLTEKKRKVPEKRAQNTKRTRENPKEQSGRFHESFS